MPINFQPYRAQETDLLTPAMNMVKLKQDQEQMGLLRDYRQVQMQQMEQQQAQQARENEMKDLEMKMKVLDMYSKADPTDELTHKNLTNIFPPEKYGIDWPSMPIEEMKQYKQAMKEALKFHAEQKSDFTRKTVEVLAADMRRKWPAMPAGLEASIAEMEKTVQPPKRDIQIIGKQGFEATGEPGTQLTPVTPAGAIGGENITGQFITDKGITVGFSDTGGAIAYTTDAQGKMQVVPYNQAIHGKKVKEPPVQVNISNKLQTEEAKVIGQTRGEIYKKVSEASTNAETSNFSLDEFDQYLNQITTGKATPVATDIMQWAKSFGVTIDPKWNAAQALDAVSKRFALSFRNPAGGSGMPGNFSDQDRKYLQDIAPSLGKSVEANRMIIDAMKKVNQRRIKTLELADEYYDVHESMKGFGKHMQDYADKNPLFHRATKTTLPNGMKKGW